MKKLLLLIMFFIFSVSYSQTEKQRKTITANYNLEKLKDLSNELLELQKGEKEDAISQANIKGWDLSFTKDGEYYELRRISSEGKPIYIKTYNKDAGKSTRANHLHNGGTLGLNVEGQGMTAYVWDAGVARVTHNEYDGPGGTNRYSDGEPADLHSHSAHVMGTIIASGYMAQAKGMAPQAHGIGYDWDSDMSEATDEAANGMLVSNHSYGPDISLVPDWSIGAYTNEAKIWDQILYDAPYYMMVVAAGNDGWDNTSNGDPLDGNHSYDKLNSHCTSKNNLVVANAQDANVNSNGELLSVSINSGSSEGPTDDYRIKPDLAGNGTDLYSSTETSDNSYQWFTGTSMASPNVAGSILILQQHYNNVNGNFMRASTLKGLVLHTADDAGPNGPDAVWGWGLMNTKAAAEAISQNGIKSLVLEESLNDGESYTITVISDSSNPLKASICWTDVPGTANSGTANDPTPVLVNDLDIRVTKGSTFEPWKLTGVTTNAKGDNNVDPFERVDITGASGIYTITVTHKGTLTNGKQDFALVVTGVDSDFTFNAVESEVTQCAPANAVFNFEFVTATGSTSNTMFTADNLPSGATATFSPSGMNSDGTFSMTVSGLSNVVPGVYDIDVTATNATESETKKVTLSVYSPDFNAPALLSPNNNAYNLPYSFDLTWGEDFNNESFEIQIARDSNFTDIFLTDTVDTEIYHAFNLENDMTYYWRVKPMNQCASGSFSATKQFSTAPCVSYEYSGAPQSIPDDSGASSLQTTFTVTETFTVEDVNVFVDITHDDASTLVLSLISPDGTNVYLETPSIYCDDTHNMKVALNDAEDEYLTCIDDPNYQYFGNFKPEFELSAFNGKSATGTWTLEIRDLNAGLAGFLNSWSLNICNDAYSGVDENQFEDFSLWPNPSDGTFNISFALVDKSQVKIELYDISGRLISTKRFNENSSSDFNETINFGDISKGLYFVKVENGKRFITEKVLINK